MAEENNNDDLQMDVDNSIVPFETILHIIAASLSARDIPHLPSTETLTTAMLRGRQGEWLSSNSPLMIERSAALQKIMNEMHNLLHQ